MPLEPPRPLNRTQPIPSVLSARPLCYVRGDPHHFSGKEESGDVITDGSSANLTSDKGQIGFVSQYRLTGLWDALPDLSQAHPGPSGRLTNELNARFLQATGHNNFSPAKKTDTCGGIPSNRPKISTIGTRCDHDLIIRCQRGKSRKC